MQQYLEHSRKILSDRFSYYKPNRTGIDTISRFGHQTEYDLSEGFPLLTTKAVRIDSIIHELIWFLRGDTNIRYLVNNGVPIWNANAFQHYLRGQGRDKVLKPYSPEWKTELKDYIARIATDDAFAREHGNLGDVYGAKWRRWRTSDGKTIDQLGDVVEMLRRTPNSRRLVVSAWDPTEVSFTALPPCHILFHLNTRGNYLDLFLYQRSCDMFLGVPFNIASYAMLTQILAQQADLKPGLFVHSLGDAHFYCGAHERGALYGSNLDSLKARVSSVRERQGFLDVLNWVNQNAPKEGDDLKGQDHVTAILEQLAREPRELPRMHIARKPFDQLAFEDFALENYEPHPVIKRAMAV